jgi:hypothetical protein
MLIVFKRASLVAVACGLVGDKVPAFLDRFNTTGKSSYVNSITTQRLKLPRYFVLGSHRPNSAFWRVGPARLRGKAL